MREKTPIREQVAQRKLPTPQRVKPLTLGDLARGGVKYIDCECDWCRHEGRIELAPLLEEAGAEALYRNVAQHFLCSVCGWRGVNAWPIWPGGKGHKRPARRMPGLPSIKECRAVLDATRVEPDAQALERRAAYVQALMERWPEMGAPAALFVVQHLKP